MPFVTVCGKNIYYEEYGAKEKKTVVYLHGGPGESCLTYTAQAQKLGAYSHVISFDQYGVFRSDAIPETQQADVKFHVDLLEQMRIALGISSWIPLGHSFGGMLALVYAHTYPESTDAVIYDCPMWSALHTARAIAEATLPCFTALDMTEQAALCRAILQEGISPKEAFDTSLRIDISEPVQRACHVIEMSRYQSYIEEHIPDPNVTEECWGKYIPFRQKLFDSADFYEDYLPQLAEITKPQLLIVGEYDMTCGKYEQNYFDAHAGSGRTEILKNSAHLSWVEQPEIYTALIADFVAKMC